MDAKTLAKAEEYFAWVVNNKKHWCHGFTLKRLEAVKQHVFSNDDIMWDLFERHRFIDFTPEEAKQNDLESFWHGIGNFTSSILYTMMDKGIIKR